MTPHQTYALEYIAAQCAALAEMAKEARFEKLEHLITMAQLEAEAHIAQHETKAS